MKDKLQLVDFSKPIMCSYESYTPLLKKHITIVDEKLQIIDCRLADLDTISRNGSLYSGEDTFRSIEESKLIQERIAQGVWKGEHEHPEKNCDLKRFMSIDNKKVSHKIHKYWRNDNSNFIMMGRVQFIPPEGDMVWRWITEADMNMGFSLRIYTPNYVKKTDARGNTYLHKKYPMYPVVWDCVDMPGYEKIRVADPTEYANNNTNYKTNGQPETGSESWLIANPVNDITNILAEESTEAFNIISDLYNVDIEKARAFVNENKTSVTVRATEDLTLHVPINQYLVSMIMDRK